MTGRLGLCALVLSVVVALARAEFVQTCPSPVSGVSAGQLISGTTQCVTTTAGDCHAVGLKPASIHSNEANAAVSALASRAGSAVALSSYVAAASPPSIIWFDETADNFRPSGGLPFDTNAQQQGGGTLTVLPSGQWEVRGYPIGQLSQVCSFGSTPVELTTPVPETPIPTPMPTPVPPTPVPSTPAPPTPVPTTTPAATPQPITTAAPQPVTTVQTPVPQVTAPAQTPVPPVSTPEPATPNPPPSAASLRTMAESWSGATIVEGLSTSVAFANVDKKSCQAVSGTPVAMRESNGAANVPSGFLRCTADGVVHFYVTRRASPGTYRLLVGDFATTSTLVVGDAGARPFPADFTVNVADLSASAGSSSVLGTAVSVVPRMSGIVGKPALSPMFAAEAFKFTFQPSTASFIMCGMPNEKGGTPVTVPHVVTGENRTAVSPLLPRDVLREAYTVALADRKANGGSGSLKLGCLVLERSSSKRQWAAPVYAEPLAATGQAFTIRRPVRIGDVEERSFTASAVAWEVAITGTDSVAASQSLFVRTVNPEDSAEDTCLATTSDSWAAANAAVSVLQPSSAVSSSADVIATIFLNDALPKQVRAFALCFAAPGEKAVPIPVRVGASGSPMTAVPFTAIPNTTTTGGNVGALSELPVGELLIGFGSAGFVSPAGALPSTATLASDTERLADARALLQLDGTRVTFARWSGCTSKTCTWDIGSEVCSAPPANSEAIRVFNTQLHLRGSEPFLAVGEDTASFALCTVMHEASGATRNVFLGVRVNVVRGTSVVAPGGLGLASRSTATAATVPVSTVTVSSDASSTLKSIPLVVSAAAYAPLIRSSSIKSDATQGLVFAVMRHADSTCSSPPMAVFDGILRDGNVAALALRSPVDSTTFLNAPHRLCVGTASVGDDNTASSLTLVDTGIALSIISIEEKLQSIRSAAAPLTLPCVVPAVRAPMLLLRFNNDPSEDAVNVYRLVQQVAPTRLPTATITVGTKKTGAIAPSSCAGCNASRDESLFPPTSPLPAPVTIAAHVVLSPLVPEFNAVVPWVLAEADGVTIDRCASVAASQQGLEVSPQAPALRIGTPADIIDARISVLARTPAAVFTDDGSSFRLVRLPSVATATSQGGLSGLCADPSLSTVADLTVHRIKGDLYDVDVDSSLSKTPGTFALCAGDIAVSGFVATTSSVADAETFEGGWPAATLRVTSPTATLITTQTIKVRVVAAPSTTWRVQLAASESCNETLSSWIPLIAGDEQELPVPRNIQGDRVVFCLASEGRPQLAPSTVDILAGRQWPVVPLAVDELDFLDVAPVSLRQPAAEDDASSPTIDLLITSGKGVPKEVLLYMRRRGSSFTSSDCDANDGYLGAASVDSTTSEASGRPHVSIKVPKNAIRSASANAVPGTSYDIRLCATAGGEKSVPVNTRIALSEEEGLPSKEAAQALVLFFVRSSESDDSSVDVSKPVEVSLSAATPYLQKRVAEAVALEEADGYGSPVSLQSDEIAVRRMGRRTFLVYISPMAARGAEANATLMAFASLVRRDPANTNASDARSNLVLPTTTSGVSVVLHQLEVVVLPTMAVTVPTALVGTMKVPGLPNSGNNTTEEWRNSTKGAEAFLVFIVVVVPVLILGYVIINAKRKEQAEAERVRHAKSAREEVSPTVSAARPDGTSPVPRHPTTPGPQEMTPVIPQTPTSPHRSSSRGAVMDAAELLSSDQYGKPLRAVGNSNDTTENPLYSDDSSFAGAPPMTRTRTMTPTSTPLQLSTSGNVVADSAVNTSFPSAPAAEQPASLRNRLAPSVERAMQTDELTLDGRQHELLSPRVNRAPAPLPAAAAAVDDAEFESCQGTPRLPPDVSVVDSRRRPAQADESGSDRSELASSNGEMPMPQTRTRADRDPLLSDDD